jgi:hypothetical protein
VQYQHRNAADAVLQLMVIPDELQRIGASLSVQRDTDHQPPRLDPIAGKRLHRHDVRHEEPPVGGHDEVRRVDDTRRDQARHDGNRHPPAPHPKRGPCPSQDHRAEEDAHRPAPAIQHVGEAQRIETLAPWQRHDEPHVRELEDHEQRDAAIK